MIVTFLFTNLHTLTLTSIQYPVYYICSYAPTNLITYMKERGRERTAAGLGAVGRRGAAVGGRGRGGRGVCLLTLIRVSYVF